MPLRNVAVPGRPRRIVARSAPCPARAKGCRRVGPRLSSARGRPHDRFQHGEPVRRVCQGADRACPPIPGPAELWVARLRHAAAWESLAYGSAFRIEAGRPRAEIRLPPPWRPFVFRAFAWSGFSWLRPGSLRIERFPRASLRVLARKVMCLRRESLGSSLPSRFAWLRVFSAPPNGVDLRPSPTQVGRGLPVRSLLARARKPAGLRSLGRTWSVFSR
jgi:hypothetical protein